jgi:hypothetical protein
MPELNFETCAVYIINGLLLIVAYFIKNGIDEAKTEIHLLKTKQERTEMELNRLHVLLPTNYVTRGDFMVLFARLDELQKATATSLLDIHSLLVEGHTRRRSDKE